MRTSRFKIDGLDCAEEIAIIKAELAPLTGIENLAFDLLNGKLTVVHQATLDSAEILGAVSRAGLRAEAWHDSREPRSPTGRWTRWGRTFMTFVSGFCLATAFVIHAATQGWQSAFGAADGVMPVSVRLLYVTAVAAGSWFVIPKALRAISRRRADMHLLMVVAVLGAVVIGEYFEAAAVAFLFAVSLALEAWSIGRARRAIAALLALTPGTARVLHQDGSEELLPVESVAIGTTVIVRPGDKIPLDGTVTKGETNVNQAPITGESMPAPKSIGSQLYAGTINEDGAIEFVTTKPATDTTLARIIQLVEVAQSRRAPSEQWVEKFAQYYTPAVMLMALFLMAVPPLLFSGSWSKWFYEGLVLLVIACPCALVISTPISIVSALTSAARRGVLVKGGQYIEAPASLRAIALDKTGTLTVGRPVVREVIPLSGHTTEEVLALAASVEMRSEHPLARAIVRAATERGLRPVAADDFKVLKGRGGTAILNGRLIWVGSHRMLEERGQETPDMHERLEAFAKDGSSVVVIGKEEHVCGLIAVADDVRGNARSAVQSLRAAGIQRIVMLTGDNRGTAEAVGFRTAVDEVRAELLPEDKVAAIEELVDRYGQVAMIGDGVNDAPALARASLGIAMGAAGTDAALETADVVLMGDDLSAVAWLRRHSQQTLGIIRQNIGLSLAVKLIFVALTFVGHASLWAAIAADMGASLLVIANGLRLLNSSPRLDESQFG